MSYKYDLYIAGPMTGLPDFNRAQFNVVAAAARRIGLRVANPAEIELERGAEWNDYMEVALHLLVDSEKVIMLPGWQSSKGARAEAALAAILDKPVIRAESNAYIPKSELLKHGMLLIGGLCQEAVEIERENRVQDSDGDHDVSPERSGV